MIGTATSRQQLLMSPIVPAQPRAADCVDLGMKKIGSQATKVPSVRRSLTTALAGAFILGGSAIPAQAQDIQTELPVGLNAADGGHCQFNMDYSGDKSWIVFYTIVRNCVPSKTGPIEFEEKIPLPIE